MSICDFLFMSVDSHQVKDKHMSQRPNVQAAGLPRRVLISPYASCRHLLSTD